MPESTGLEREVRDIVRREVAEILGPLMSAFGSLPRSGGGRGAASDSAVDRPRRGRPPGRPAGRPARGAGQGGSSEWSGQSIRDLRQSLGLTQKAFAQRAGVTPVAVYQWESGRSRPRAGSVAKISRLAKGGAGESSSDATGSAPARRGRRVGKKRGRRAGASRK